MCSCGCFDFIHSNLMATSSAVDMLVPKRINTIPIHYYKLYANKLYQYTFKINKHGVIEKVGKFTKRHIKTVTTSKMFKMIGYPI